MFHGCWRWNIFFNLSLLLCVKLCLTTALQGSKFAKCELNQGQTVYEVTPGMGWDNLRNVEMGRVLEVRYDDCLTSQDGKYLLANGITLTPLKQSHVDLDSEMFAHFNNYTSLTALSINLDGSALIQDVGISGSFSNELQTVKSKLVDTKSVITRVNLRHEMYEASAQPDSPLSLEFRNRLLDMASHLLADPSSSESLDADYEADLLVRDFGTHVITSTKSGAILSKIDHLSASYIQSMQGNMNTMRHSASVSFLNFFKMGISTSYKVSNEEVERYQNNTSHSLVLTVGGPPFAQNFSLDSWGDDIINNLVAIDRRGDPLFFVVNTRSLQELPEPVVYKVARRVQQAVFRYYKANALRGCMDLHSSNFNENANIDSGDCTTPSTNFTFGGVFQACLGPQEICKDMEQRNPATGDFTCSEDYEAVELHFSPTQRCKEYCHTEWYVVFTKVTCTTKCASLRTSWCSPKSGTASSLKGFLMGGMFTQAQSNPVTNDRTCPPNFFGVNFGLQGILCLSADSELGAEYQLSFGGFFSCSTGNPLALHADNAETADEPSTSGLRSSVNKPAAVNKSSGLGFINQQFWAERGARNWPSRCGAGYTQHLAFMDNSCEIMYCVKTNELSRLARRHIKRPPFVNLDYTSPNRSLRVTEIVGANNELWVRNKGGVWQRDYQASRTDNSIKTGSQGHVGVVLTSVFVTLLVVAIIAAFIYGTIQYRQKYSRNGYTELESPMESAYQEPPTLSA